jgi:hypothetical protein
MKLPPQWINCDLRTFDYSVLGKFHVIMADPPWDIHMSVRSANSPQLTENSTTNIISQLPYGTMKDDEMRAMPIPLLQDEGFLFLWVTGRAMEVGRECLEVWGYQRIDEVVWVKTNQVCISPIFPPPPYSRSRKASARHSNRSNGPLAQPHKGAHAGRRQARSRLDGQAQVPFLGQPWR